MIRKKIVAGNWKMNKLFAEGETLAKEVTQAVKKGIQTRSSIAPLVVLAPPYFLLKAVADITAGTQGIFTSAQNAASEEAGAFTGEVSAAMIASAGASFAIVGHSERRTLFGEEDAILAQKVNQCLKNKLTPIFCVGELLQQRLDGEYFQVVKKQLEAGLFHLDASAIIQIVIAYEPVWAIGTGHTATSGQAQEMHLFIRETLKEHYSKQVSDQISILYGGSCKPDNATELFSMPDVDGGLIGGASLKASDFMAIVQSL